MEEDPSTTLDFRGKVKTCDAEETRGLLPYPELAARIRSVALDRKSGRARAPERIALPLAGGGTLLVMPAADGEIAVTKLVSVHPHNNALGLPTIQGEVIVMEADTGRRLGVLDGAEVTARRTAALSLLAAMELAERPEGPLLIVGAGTQGLSHLEAFHAGLDGLKEVFVHSRSAQRAEDLAEHARNDLGLEARAVESPEAVIRDAGLIVTATTSAEPVLPGKLPDGAFVAAVGAFRPDLAELSAETIRDSEVVVDTLEGAKSEAGELMQAGKSGDFEWESATELQDLLAGERRLKGGRRVVFESVGCALWDLAAARVAFA